MVDIVEIRAARADDWVRRDVQADYVGPATRRAIPFCLDLGYDESATFLPTMT